MSRKAVLVPAADVADLQICPTGAANGAFAAASDDGRHRAHAGSIPLSLTFTST